MGDVGSFPVYSAGNAQGQSMDHSSWFLPGACSIPSNKVERALAIAASRCLVSPCGPRCSIGCLFFCVFAATDFGQKWRETCREQFRPIASFMSCRQTKELSLKFSQHSLRPPSHKWHKFPIIVYCSKPANPAQTTNAPNSKDRGSLTCYLSG